MSNKKLASIKANVVIKSDMGGTFENEWSANAKKNQDPKEALLAVISYLGFVAERSGVAEKAKLTLDKAIKEEAE